MQIETADLSKSYDGVDVLRDVAVDVADRHAITIVGPSGGGKTTLLRIIAGLEHPSAGSVAVNGTPVVYEENALREYRKTVGMVFQQYNLFPHMSALSNITFPLEKVHGLSKEESRDRAVNLLQRFKLEEHAHKRPGQLSGGQKQRIAISRAIAIDPQFLILDEPTSALDPEFTAGVLDMILELRAMETDLLLVTHHMGFARSVSDYIIFISDGRVAEQGSSEHVFSNPDDPAVQQFFDRVLRY